MCYPCDLTSTHLNVQLTIGLRTWRRLKVFWYLLTVGRGLQEMPALLKTEWRRDVTPTHDLYIYPLWAQIQLHSIKCGPQRCLLNCRLEGFLLAALFSSCRGILFASANPLSLPSFCGCLCFPFVLIFLPLSLLSSSVPALLNISSYVSDTFAKLSWTGRDSQQDSQLYVAFMNNRKLLFPSLPHQTQHLGGAVSRVLMQTFESTWCALCHLLFVHFLCLAV